MDPVSQVQSMVATRFEEPSLPDWQQMWDHIKAQRRFWSGLTLSILIHILIFGVAPHKQKPEIPVSQAMNVHLETQHLPSKQKTKTTILTADNSNISTLTNSKTADKPQKPVRHIPRSNKANSSSSLTAKLTQAPPAVMAWWQYKSEDMGYYVAEELDQLASPSNGAGFLQPVLGVTPDQPGRLLVRIYINEHGGTDRVEILDATPPGVFEQAVMLELYKSSFIPAIKHGVAVKSQKDLDIRFDVLINQRMLETSGERPEIFDPR